MYTTTIGTANDTHGMTFIEQADINQILSGTPSSCSQATKKSVIINPQHQHLNYQNQHVYETSPPTQKQKGMTSVNAVGAMKQLVNSTTSKSR
jgi:hypothetical protein